MRILVTGGTGFTGKVLVKRLLDEGHEVIAMDYKEGINTQEIRDWGAEVRFGNKRPGLKSGPSPGCRGKDSQLSRLAGRHNWSPRRKSLEAFQDNFSHLPAKARRIDWYRQNRAFKIDKATKELGYNPRAGIEEGLIRTAKWYMENGYI